MQKYLRSFFPPIKLDHEDRIKLNIKTYQTKRAPILFTGVMIVLIELAMTVWFALSPGPIFGSKAKLTYIILYLSLFTFTLICLIVLVLGREYFNKKPVAFMHLCYVYGFFICMWSGYITAFAHRNALDISVFLYISLFVAVLIPMKPWKALVLFAVSWVFFMIALPWYLSPDIDPFSSQVNSALASFMSVIISALMYRARVTEYINEKTILQQSEKIQIMNDKLSMMVTVDELTQIYNRRFMDREFPTILESARNEKQPVALMLIDIDHFKQYNDRYGHLAGDECLRNVAAVINNNIPDENTYLVRFGGEEFLILTVGNEPDKVRDMAENIRKQMEDACITHEDAPCGCVTVSIGVCCSRGYGKATLTQLIRYSDDAMYDAKSAGRNKVVIFLFNGSEN